jgi:glycosyltransferase involved in cell wall biosynthesis
VCDELARRGHEVTVLGINYYGDPHPYPYPIYPCRHPFASARDLFGVDRLPRLIHELGPDVVVLLNDPWNVPAYLDMLAAVRDLNEGFPQPLMAAWLAVDGKNQKDSDRLDELDAVAVWTEFGARELKAGGYTGEPAVIQLGVDLERFGPRSKAEARRLLMPESLPDDAFIVGAVGRNQPRKRLDLTIAYFAEWVRRGQHENAYLYLHVGPTGDTGCDIRSLVKYYGINGRVFIGAPPIGSGIPEQNMPDVYSAMDVYISTSQGEGWGLTALEAMACGVPCILPRWSAYADWSGRGEAVLVPCHETALTAPMNGLMHTVGGVPDRRTFIAELETMYSSEVTRRTYSRRGLRLAAEYPWSRSAAEMADFLEKQVESKRQQKPAEEVIV